MYTMNSIVHARLDPETLRLLRRLSRRFGWNDSEVVRRGIQALAERAAGDEQPANRVIGLGAFSSGIPDLGSNKKRLVGFGR
jgi:hypothetical protein